MRRIVIITLVLALALFAAGCGPSHSEINESGSKLGLSECIITKQGGILIGEARCTVVNSKGETCEVTSKVDGGGDTVTFNPEKIDNCKKGNK